MLNYPYPYICGWLGLVMPTAPLICQNVKRGAKPQFYLKGVDIYYEQEKEKSCL